MKSIRNLRFLLLLPVLALACVQPASAVEGDEPAMTPEMQAEMAAWMALAQPGPHHEHLAPFVGTWKGKVQMWMAPGTEPMVEESVAEIAWILGGRFLEWKHTGHFAGMPFEGIAIEGYNNGDKQYESVWMDNFGTIMLPFTGSCSKNGKHREMLASFTDAVGGGTIEYRTVYTWTDDDHFTYSSFSDKGDGEFKNMVIEYERQ